MKARQPVTVAETRLAERCRRGRVIIIDDDDEILRALSGLIEMEGYVAEPYPSATAYLDAPPPPPPCFPGPICILSDVKMAHMDGLQLQERVASAGGPPLVLMSGNSGAAEAITAFRAGVVDFLLKPIEDDLLFTALDTALARSRDRHQLLCRNTDLAQRVAQLTGREREIVRLASQGVINRDIATRLGIALRTVKLHRQRAMEKLGIERIIDLLRLDPAELSPPDP